MSDIAFTTLRAAGYEGQLGDMLYKWSLDYPQDFNSNTLGGDGWTEYWRAGLGTAMPPLSPVDGDVWTTLNGHSAEFDGTEWVAVNPLTNNVAEILGNSTFWIDAKASTVGEQEAVNYGLGGSVLDAQYGSIQGAYVRGGAAVLPGVADNYLSVPNTSTTSEDFEVAVRVSPASFTGEQVIVGKDSGGAGGRGFRLTFNVQTLRFWSSLNGTDLIVKSSGANVPYSTGETFWVRATLDGDVGDTSSVVRFYTAPDQESEPTTWTQLGADQTNAGPQGVFGSAVAITLGLYSASASPFAGDIYRAIVRNNIGGAAVLDVDLSGVADGATSFTAVTGQTVTVNTTGVDTNDPKLLTHTGENYAWTPGTTTDYLQVADSLATRPFGDTIHIEMEFTPTVTPTGVIEYLFAKAEGWVGGRNYDCYLRNNNSLLLRMVLNGDGDVRAWGFTAAAGVDGFEAGKREKLRWVVETATGTCDFYRNDVLVESLPSGPVVQCFGIEPLRIGSRSSSGASQAMKIHGFKVGADDVDTFVFDAATDIVDGASVSVTPSVGDEPVVPVRPTLGRKTALVTRPTWLFGTDDYLEVADNALLDFGTDEFTALAVGRTFDSPVSAPFIAKRDSVIGGVAEAGWMLNTTTLNRIYGSVSDGATGGNATSASNFLTEGQLEGWLLIRDSGNTRLVRGSDLGETSVSASAGSVDNSLPVVVGANSTHSAFINAEIVTAAIWDRVLTDDEITAINAYYGTV